MGVLLEGRFQVFDGFFYGVVVFVVNWTAIYFLIGPFVSVALLLLAAYGKHREYVFWAIADIVFSLLHFVALFRLVTA